MKHLPNIAAGLLGIAFITFGLNHFFPFLPPFPAPPEGSPVAMFMGAVYSTGFMSFVKAFEIIGAILVIIPKTRNFGLLILGPIIINILAFNIFIAGGAAVFQGPVIVVSVLAAYLLAHGHKKFCGLLNN